MMVDDDDDDDDGRDDDNDSRDDGRDDDEVMTHLSTSLPLYGDYLSTRQGCCSVQEYRRLFPADSS